MFNGDAAYAADQLKQLVGGKIVDTVITEDQGSYGFIVEKDGEKKICWVDCDPEGNGPGWLQIEEKSNVVKPKTTGG